MISPCQSKVQAIKSKFENLNCDNEVQLRNPQCKQSVSELYRLKNRSLPNKENCIQQDTHTLSGLNESHASEASPRPNVSYLYKTDVKRSLSDSKTSLSRQISDPGKKLHRSHAFRCDRNQKVNLCPKLPSCSQSDDMENSRIDKKLSKDRLEKLSHLLEEQMKKENFVFKSDATLESVPDEKVPKHILDQYAKVDKKKKEAETKPEAMTDSGVSSETENLDEEKNRVKNLKSQFEMPSENKTNLGSMDPLCVSSETMRLERKNPHLILTDTLKKALKQPLPVGPPPKKPPRTVIQEFKKKDTKHMLEKLELVLQNRENSKDKVEEVPKKPKEMHYLCTEILDIANRDLSPESNCFNPLRCALPAISTVSLPYSRLNENKNKMCNHNQGFTTFLNESPQNKLNDWKTSDKCEGNSKFYLDEPIYDEPCTDDGEDRQTNNYGTLLKVQNEDLNIIVEDKIYDEPCGSSPPSPIPPASPKTEFEKIRQNFENGILLAGRLSKSTENMAENYKMARKSFENKFATDGRVYKKMENKDTNNRYRKDSKQLEVDKENLNRLMEEIYATVSAACEMDNKPATFPTDADGSTSEDSAKLTRSLTEKRKNYVRRVSSRVAYLDPKNLKALRNIRYRHQTSICSYKSDIVDNYNTFRSWKSFRNTQSSCNVMADSDSKFNLTDSRGNVLSMKDEMASVDSIDNMSIDEKTGCLDIGLPFVPRERGLFNVCLLVGLNHMSGEAYVKSVFPNQVQVPPHIENLIFPETLNSPAKGEWSAEGSTAQCYSLVLTDERGERSYGYCRRVLPEGTATCLPLCYCLIGKYRAPGFYYKILQEIESHHGSSDTEINNILQQLFEYDFPNPGEDISIKFTKRTNIVNKDKSKTMPDTRTSYGRFSPNGLTHSLNSLDQWNQSTPSLVQDASSLGQDAYSLGQDASSLGQEASSLGQDASSLVKDDYDKIPDYYDLENNNGVKRVTMKLQTERRKTIKMPLEPRVDEHNLSMLLDSLGTGLVIKIFGSLLLERKIVIVSDQLSLVSSCIEALQSILYPFVWQQTLISTIPSEIRRDVLEAPLPMLAGVLKTSSDDVQSGLIFEEGMLIDLTHPNKVIFYQGDESTILPTSSYKTLKTSLQMETMKQREKQEDKVTRNVLISEAFIRFFVNILGDFWRFFSFGELQDGCLGKGGVIFDKEAFKKSASSKQNQYFLEWFTETSMFTHFIQNMAVVYQNNMDSELSLVDLPYPNYYEIFEGRVRCRTKSIPSKSVDGKTNYKSAMNKKVKLLKSKLKDLIS